MPRLRKRMKKPISRLTLIRKMVGLKDLYLCSCGKEKLINRSNIKSEMVFSCGCLREELNKSGEITRKYNKRQLAARHRWDGMMQRCYNKRASSYKHYGGRGIGVCERWKNFDNFYSDMGAPSKGASLDRINNNGGYSPDNCRWASGTTQCSNTRRNVYVSYDGKRLTLSQWARVLGVSRQMIDARIARGWPIEKVLSVPKFGVVGKIGRPQKQVDTKGVSL